MTEVIIGRITKEKIISWKVHTPGIEQLGNGNACPEDKKFLHKNEHNSTLKVLTFVSPPS